jgi:hypothetical protein
LGIRLSSKTPFEESLSQEIYWQSRQSLFYPPVEGKVIGGFEGLDMGDQVRDEVTESDVE